MQHIDAIRNDRDGVVSELKKFIARDSYSILVEPSIELGKLTQVVLGVMQSKFWKEVKKGTDVKTEFTIMTSFGDDFLTGTIDRLYRDGSGVWNILDYKTDSVTEDSVQEKTLAYESQLKFYALLVGKYFSVDEVQANLLFTSALDSPVQHRYSRRELRSFENELLSTLQKIHSGEFRREGRACNGCPFLPAGCSSLSL
jgi:RecB family exonuclease